MSEPVDILVAEDDEMDVLLLRRAFKEAGLTQRVHIAPDGQQAIDFLQQRSDEEQDRLPAVVLLDLKMPRRNGLDVLRWMRAEPAIRCIPAIIFSSSAHREDVERAYALGANAFIVKPASTVQRVEVARFIQTWLKLNQSPLAVTEGFKTARALHALRGYAPPSAV